MRVVHICCVGPQGGGMGKVADKEVRLLIKKGVEAWLICPQKCDTSYEHVIKLPSLRLGNASRLQGLLERLEDADIVHLHYPYYGTAGLIARLRMTGKIKRLVITLHMDATAKGLKGWIFNLHRKYMQPQILKAADELYVSSNDYAASSSFSDLITNQDKRVLELPFGVDVDAFFPAHPSRSEFGVPDDAYLIGSVSVLDKAHDFKGIDLLVKALAQLPERAHLLIVGGGELLSFYKKMAQKFGVSNRAHFIGFTDRARLIRALQSLNVFAFPSKNGAEAFGLAMLEAMACQVPVIASDLPGVRSVAKDAGIIIPPNDLQALINACNGCMQDTVLCEKLASSARAKALQYSWNRHIDILTERYQKLCV
ncbi:glycosyltransferase family 4 protein [Patescibacteria group bacterium]|nr:glycosyltransferase family 4 protein [Patescibacteria group bacterium]